MKKTNSVILVQDTNVKVKNIQGESYISLTDMTASFGGSRVIENWLRNKNTLEFLGVWEKLHNESFNSPEFEGIKSKAGLNRFTISAKEWSSRTNAIGLHAVTGRYGGTYAHQDIAFEFGSWLSPEFKLYLILEFQRLKEKENEQGQWDVKRELSKINYLIHTDAVKDNLIPESLTKKQQGYVYANEADVLNVALFGCTAKRWREENTTLKGNIRDHASIEQLLVLTNLESHNASMIRDGIDQQTRLNKLNEIAISQIKSLLSQDIKSKLPQGKLS